MKRSICQALLFLTVSCAAFAQNQDLEALCRKLPADTIGFIATSGTEEFSGEFKASVLGPIAADPQVKNFFDQVVAAVTESEKFKSAGETKIYMDFAQQVLRSPTVIALATSPNGFEDDPRVLLISKTVTDKNELKTMLENSLSAGLKSGKIQKEDRNGTAAYVLADPNLAESFYAAQSGDYLVAAVNDPEFTLLTNGGANAAMADILNRVPSARDAFVYYIDIHKIISLAEKECEGEKEGEKVKPVMQSLGLYEMENNLLCGGFEGKNVVCQNTLKVSTSQGIWKVLGQADRDLFKYADTKAMQAGVVRFDAAQLYDTILGAVTQADADAAGEFTTKVAEIEAQLQFKLREDLLGNLEGSFMGYVLPAYAAPDLMVGGYVATAKVKDGAKMEKCLLSLGNFLSSIGQKQVQITSQTTDGGKEVHIWAVTFMAMMQVIPSWAIEGDTLIFTSHPSLTKQVIAQFGPGAHESLLSNTKFGMLLKDVPADAFMIGLSDSKTVASQMMQTVQRIWPMATMGLAQEGIQLPIMLPSIDAYLEQMEPGLRYGRKTSDGIETYYRGTGLEVNAGSIAGGSMAAAILMPALAKTKQIAKRSVSATNLKGIGIAAMVYANDHEGKFPSKLEDLVAECDLGEKSLVSPQKPDDFEGPSYILVEGLTTEAPADSVLAYENPAFARQDMTNVLYADGHVAYESREAFEQNLKKTYETLRKPMPEIQWETE